MLLRGHSIIAPLVLLATCCSRPATADETEATIVDLRKCLSKARPRAIQVLLGGFRWSSGSSGSSVPDVWTYNDDCTIDQEPGLLVSVFNDDALLKDDWKGHKKIVAHVRKLLKDDPTRPVVLVGHSFGGGALPKVCDALWNEAGIMPDLVVAIEAVKPSRFLLGDKLKTCAGAVVHIRTADDKVLPNVAEFPGRPEYVIEGTEHTDIDQSPECYDILRYLFTRLPEKGINSLGRATPKDYKPVSPPCDLGEFPENVRRPWKRGVTVRIAE